MRVNASEKLELIHLTEGSSLSVRRTLAEIGLARSTFYAGYKRYLDGGFEALEDRKPRPPAVWNKIPGRVRDKGIETALTYTELSPRELACRITDRDGEFLSESSVYRILKAADLIESPPTSSCRQPTASRIQHAGATNSGRRISRTCRWWAGNVVRLENYYSPWELERAIARFVSHYNTERVHESIGNVTPDDMYHGRQHDILSRRNRIKRLTLERREKENQRDAAKPQVRAKPSLSRTTRLSKNL